MSERRWEFDALRGLMLVMMTLTHIPTHFSVPFGQMFGYVSAAFGFVLMSGFMAGLVYTKIGQRQGQKAMFQAFGRRAFTVYLCHLGLLAFLFALVPHSGIIQHPGPVPGMLWLYSRDIFSAVTGSILLLHQPGMFDILPMYVLFLLLSAPVLMLAQRVGWRLVLLLSLLVWALAQVGLSPLIMAGLIDASGLLIPHGAGSAFDLLAWQLLWVTGLMLGSRLVMGEPLAVAQWPRWMVPVAVLIFFAGFVGRHSIGQVPFPEAMEWRWLLDKWQMGPLRLLNAAAIVFLIMRFAPQLRVHAPNWRFLRQLGSASLPVFVTHVVLAVAVLGLIGDELYLRSPVFDVFLLVLVFTVLWAVACLSSWKKRQRKAGSAPPAMLAEQS